MDFLKDVFGAEALTYAQLVEKLKGNKNIRLANLASGQYVKREELEGKIAELATANNTITGLQNTIKKFDGVDVEKLQQEAKDWETKYNDAQNQVLEQQKKFALVDGLKSIGVADPDYLIYKHGGVESFSFDSTNKPVGLEEMVKPDRELYPHVFRVEETVKTGMRHTGSEGSMDKKEEANAAFRSLFGKE